MEFNAEKPVSRQKVEFIKLPDGTDIVGMFSGEPIVFYQHGYGKTSFPCRGEACAACADGANPTFRFRLNFLTKNQDGGLSYKIFENSWTVYQQLGDLQRDGGLDLSSTVLKIKRTGKMKETRYSIFEAKSENRDDYVKSASTLKLLDLKKAWASLAPDSEFDAQSNADDLPF